MDKKLFFHVKKRTLPALADIIFWVMFIRYSETAEVQEK